MHRGGGADAEGCTGAQTCALFVRRSPPNRDPSIPIGPRTPHVAHTPASHRPHAAQVFLSYLPLSHIAAMELDVMFHCATGGQIYFATPDALSGGLLPLLQQSRPTFFFAVPRVWEKMMDGIKAKSAENSDTKKKIAIAAKACGLSRNMSLAQTGGESSGDCGIMYTIYRMLVRQQCTRHTHPRTLSPLAHRPHATTVTHTRSLLAHFSRAGVREGSSNPRAGPRLPAGLWRGTHQQGSARVLLGPRPAHPRRLWHVRNDRCLPPCRWV